MTWKHLEKNDQEQTGLLTIVKGFSDDIHLGKHPNWAWHHHPRTGVRRYIQIPGNEWRGRDTTRQNKRKDYRKQHYRRIRIVTKSELNAVNRVEAINTPLVAYSFNIVDWKMEDLRQLDRKTRKLLTLQRTHHTQKLTWIECTFLEMRVTGAWSNWKRPIKQLQYA